MTNFETLVHDAVGCSAPALINAFSAAQKTAVPALEAITHPTLRRNEATRTLRTHLAQALFQRPARQLNGWTPMIDPARMTHLKLINKDLGITLRVLKEQGTYDSNTTLNAPARPQLSHYNPGLWDDHHHSELALLFDITNPLDAEFWNTPLRVVRTVDPIKYGSTSRLNLNIPVVDDPGFYAHDVFETASDAEDLYAHIDINNNETRQA